MQSLGQKLTRGSVFRVGNFIIQLGVAFLLTPFIIHSLGERLYGFWTLVGTFIGYYGLLDMGLAGAVSRFLAKAIGGKNHPEINKIYNTAFILFSCIGIVAILLTFVVVIISPFFIQNQQDASLFQAVILILGINVAISFPIRVFVGVLNAQMEFQLVSIIQLVGLFFRTSLIVLALTIGYKILALALISFFISMLSNIFYIYFAKKRGPELLLRRSGFHRGTVRTLFNHSYLSFITHMADLLIFHVDAFVISFYMSLSAVAHYQIAAVLVQYFNQLIGNAIGVLASYFSRMDGMQDWAGTRKALYFGLKISTTMSCFIGFGFIFWGASFIERWVGANFLDAYPVLVVLTLAMFFGLCQTPAIALLFGTSRHKIYAQINVAEGLANLVLSLILVRYYGILGVAYGTFIPMAISKLFVFPYCFCKVTDIPFLSYINELVVVVFKSGLSLILPYFIAGYFLTPDYKALFAVGLISFILYTVTVYFLVFNPKEQKIFLNNIRSLISNTS
jgi:O-antigen/teichoic acid export membrane protein